MSRFLRREKAGQVLILLALGFVFLFGLLVFTLEGGMIFLDRRQLQNAADAGALAGAVKLETLPLPTYQPAHQFAVQTIVDNLVGTTMPGSVPTTASFSGLDIGASYKVDVTAVGGQGWDTYKVVIKHVHHLFIAQATGFSDPTLSAMAQAQSGTFPFAMILFQNDFQYDNFTSSGNGSVEIQRASTAIGAGGAHSNSSFNLGSNGSLNFNPCGKSGDVWAANEIGASATTLDARTTGTQAYNDTLCSIHPVPALPYPKVNPQIPFPNYPEPAVTGPPYGGGAITSSGSSYLCPGTFSLLSVSGGTTVLLPGVYDFTGTIALSGGGTIRTATAADWTGGTWNFGGTGYNCSGAPTQPADGDYGIIIEITPSTCTTSQLDISGNSSANLNIYSSPKYNHIAVYVELYGGATWDTTGPCHFVAPSTLGGTHIVYLAGQGTYSIRGAIYGPADNMTLEGNGGGYGVGQILAWTAAANGNGILKENYDPQWLPYFRGLIQ